MSLLSSVSQPDSKRAAGKSTGTWTRRRVALWSDDAAAVDGWKHRLELEGLVVHASAARDEVAQLIDANADALLLVLSGSLAEHLPWLREIRSASPWTPLLVACRPLRELDQVLALEMGADDVLDAGWSPAVVCARLRARWRQASMGVGGHGASAAAETLRFGRLAIRAREREVTLAGRKVPLTEGEFEVLWLLARHAGKPLSRRDILRQVRSIDDAPLDRSIDSRVYRIRAKLGDTAAPQRIRTVRHRGYLFSDVGW